MKTRLCLFLFLVSASLHAAAPIRLHYLQNHPVEQQSRLEIVIKSNLPGSVWSGSSTQYMKALTTLVGEQVQSESLPPSYDLLFELKEFKTTLNTQGHEMSSSSDKPDSFAMAHFSRLLNRPIPVHVDADHHAEVEDAEVMRIIQESPTLQNIPLRNFMDEWYFPVFALAGKELAEGNVYRVNAPMGYTTATYVFEVKSITDSAIMAKVEGTLKNNDLKIGAEALVEGSKFFGAELTLSGNIHGEVLWNRDNGLLCQASLFTDFESILKVGENSWNLGIAMRHELESLPHPTEKP